MTKKLFFDNNETALHSGLENAEISALESARRLNAIMQSVNCGITASIVRGDSLEILFANDRFFELYGHTRSSYFASVSDNYALIHPDDRDRVRQQIIAAGHCHEGVTTEFRIIRPDGRIAWLRVAISVSSFPGSEEPVELGIFYDITEEHAAEEQLHFLNDVSHELLAQPDSDRAIEDTLWKLLTYFGANRAYVFEFDALNSTTDSTYEVCAKGVSSEKENLRNIPFETIGFWLHIFDDRGFVCIPDVDALDDSRQSERDTLQPQGIKSLIAVPIMRDGDYIGFIGVDDPTVQLEHIDRLEALGDYISLLLTRRDLSRQIREENESVTSIVDGIPGGFARMQLMPDGTAQTLYLSEGFCNMVDMDDALLKIYAHDAVGGVYPEDLDIVRQMIEGLKTGVEANNIRFRLICGNGGYVWTIVFGRTRTNDMGETFLRIYYTDATELVSAEEKQIELLDNLPCGAALYEYDGKQLKTIHLNRHFWELIDREPNRFGNAPVLDATHPGDRDVVLQELTAAIRQNRDFGIDIRILCGGGLYKPFHIAGKITSRKDGSYLIYAAYTPISDEAMSTQELLPIALYTMLSASTDFSYIKGPDDRYVCCNPAMARLSGLESERDIIGKTDDEIFRKDYAAQHDEADRSVLESGEAIIDSEESFPTKDGGSRYCVTSRYPMRDTLGNVIGVYVLSRDVTEAKENESRLTLLTNSIGAGIASYELSADGTGRCLYYNDGFFRATGYTREQFEAIISKDPLGLIFEADRRSVARIVKALHEGKSDSCTCTYRCHTSENSYRWFSMTGTITRLGPEVSFLSIVQYDINDQKKAERQLRLSEQRLRLTVRHSGISVCEYNLADKTLTTNHQDLSVYNLPPVMKNIPYSSVESGEISADTAENYIAFYEGILRGEDNASVRYKRKLKGKWHWLEARSSLIYSEDGTPISAVVSFSDVSEQAEKEAIYKKWEQSIQGREEESYTLLRCNLNKDDSIDSREGSLLAASPLSAEGGTFNSRAASFAKQRVIAEDRDRFLALVNSDAMIAAYYRNNRTSVLEYREPLANGSVRWLRLTVELVQYPNSTDIAAYMLFENIDSEKRDELEIRALAETDPLTGILNRKAFVEQANEILSRREPGREHALIMIDLDGFKILNDTLGHNVGDKALMDVASGLRDILRKDDLFGRLGGDEFFVLLHDIPNDDVAANKAKQICARLRRSYSPDVRITASLGISICPRHGDSFETLYKKADSAMYHVKNLSRDSYAFYYDGIEHDLADAEREAGSKPKPFILIVDDSPTCCASLSEIFKEDYRTEFVTDGAEALRQLRHHGTAVNVVLLDLMMPGIDGFEILDLLQQSPELKTIPVIVVSSADDSETCLRALKCGAADYVTKPVNSDVIRLRVKSAVSKAENERLRAQNRVLSMESGEIARYRAALSRSGILVAEYDRLTGAFVYDPAMSSVLSGVYDNRALWQIFLADSVASQQDVERMQKLIRSLSADHSLQQASMDIDLVSVSGKNEPFRLEVFKITNEYQLSNKLILTFTRR